MYLALLLTPPSALLFSVVQILSSTPRFSGPTLKTHETPASFKRFSSLLVPPLPSQSLVCEEQMGLCFSKKRGPSPPSDPEEKKKVDKRKEKKREVAPPPLPVPEVTTEKKQVFVVTECAKKPGAAVAAAAAAEEKEKKKGETPTKKSQQKQQQGGENGGGTAVAEEIRPVPVRTSSCTKEEVDAILIQCGRLSRSSSGKGSAEAGTGGPRRYSGSKRSYDFDNEKKGEEEEAAMEWEKPVSRPSPHRRTPGRERDGRGEHKRSGSKERGSSTTGGRRGSRSPGRRTDAGPASSGSASDRPKLQPAKMVSVPAREKGSGSAESGGGMGAKRVSPAVSNKRCVEAGTRRSASPRSRSPANTTRMSSENALHHNSQPSQPQSLSRSSSRKADQSPYRRNPMAEIDENSLRPHQQAGSNGKPHKAREGEEGGRKLNQSQTQKASENVASLRKSEPRSGGGAAEIPTGIKSNSAITNFIHEQVTSRRYKEQQVEPETVEEAAEAKGASRGAEVPLMGAGIETLNPRAITGSRHSRRSSRDLEHSLGLNPGTLFDPNSYNSLLLEDIHNYHQQVTAFSLPACVSKACSILEAVADLNSSSSENRSYEADRSHSDSNSLNGRLGRMGLVHREPFVESEIVVKDDLMEPSLHKYVSVRDLGCEMEPQESAGSNSFVGQPWTPSWEPNSIESKEHNGASRSVNGEEVEQQLQSSLPGAARDSDARGRRPRGGSSTNSLPATATPGSRKRELDHHRQLHRGGGASGGSGKAGGRALSLPVAAAASS